MAETARGTQQEQADDEAPESDEPLPTREEAEARGDAAALRELAKAHRSGARGASRDLKACFECYEAAAKLGDPESHYALALFLFTGGVVPADAKAAATHLRAAADGGFVDARVYLANLYELGIHYKPDAEKADVWIRSAARAAGLADDDEALPRKLADLGVVRFARPILDDAATPPEERDALLRKIKARGFALKLREERESIVPSRTPPPVAVSVEGAPASGSAVTEPKAAEAPPEERPKRAVARSTKPSSVTIGLGASAFGYMAAFTVAAFGAAFLLGEGAKILHESRGALPLVGDRAELVFPALLAALGVLSSMLVYRMRTVASAVFTGALAASVGVHLHGTPAGHLMGSVVLQGVAFGAGAFLATLLVFGLLGGAKPRKLSA